MKIFALLLTTLALSTASCQSSNSGPATPPNASPAPISATDTDKQGKALPFLVFDNYQAIDPIFHYQNDTTYIINFWATWCKPCMEEMPYFEKLHTDLQGKKAKIILVSLDFKKEIKTKLLNFVEKRALQPQVIALTDLHYDEWIDKVDPSWSGSIPATIIYNARNRKFVEQQFSSYEELQALVNAFL
jgi:thiol-disulfide isomerase/thioredoxin